MRVINLSMQVSDEEFAAFMARLAERSTPANGMTGDAEAGDTPAAAGQALDSAGIPWIDGIHASTKTLTKEGKWRSAKGVSNEQRAAAEAPYKQTPPAMPNGGQQFQVPQSVSGVPGGVTLSTGQPPAMPGFPPVAGLPSGMPGFPPPVAPTPPAPVSYEDISNKYMALVAANKANDQTMFGLYNKYGIVDPTVLTTNESLRRSILNELNAIG